MIIVGRWRKFAPSPKTKFTIPLTKNFEVMLFILEGQVMAAAMSGHRSLLQPSQLSTFMTEL